MIFKHMAIESYKRFKFFHTYQHAKHGVGLKDKRKKKATWSTRITFNTRCSSLLFHDKHNTQAWGTIVALYYEHRKIEKDGNSPLTLSLFRYL
jgi:hypothetical protein